jgi:hypothetical protein
MRHAIICLIANPDTKQQWRAVFQGVLPLLVETDCAGEGSAKFCEGFALAADVTQSVVILLQINGDVANNLENDVQDLAGRNGSLFHNWIDPAVPREELIRRALRHAYYNLGCARQMVLSAGDNPATKAFEPLIPPP